MSEEHALTRQMEAAQLLIEQLKEIGADDDQTLVTDTIEGETGLFEAIDRMLTSIILEDEVLQKGLTDVMDALKGRQTAIKNRIERKRTALLSALQIAGLKTHKCALATLTLKAVPAKTLIIDEAAIPSKFFITPPPELDKESLHKAMKEREEALANARKLENEEARKFALTNTDDLFPAIPGAEWSNGGETIQIRK